MNRNIKRLITCAVCMLIVVVTIFGDFLGVVDKACEDMLYHHASKVDANIKIIKIDDKTMNKLGDFSKWNRDVYTQLVEKLCVSEDIRPAVIGFDVLFSSDKNKEMDEAFAKVCEKYGNVVTGLAYVFKNDVSADENGNLTVNTMKIEQKVEPYEALRKTTTQGFVNALMDEDDSIIRSTFLYFNEEDGVKTLSFSAQVFEQYMKSVGKEIVYPTDNSSMAFRYSGNPEEYENISLIDVLDGKIPPEAFDGCIVLVGAYAAGMMDAYFVPVDRAKQMYGVEIHANVIQSLLEDKTLETVPVWLEGIVATFIILALVLVCEKLSVIKVVIVCLATAIARLLLGLVLFNLGYSTNVIVVPVMAVLIGMYYIAMHYYRARMAKKCIERAFSKYVAPQVVDEISKEGTYELKLGGENRTVAALFVDIRGFTPMSESLLPEQVVDILNGYLELTTESIFRHGGTLDKFIGDATMAVFNAPFDTEDYVYKAVLAAWDIVQGGNRIEKEFLLKYGKEIGFGVGINCGPAVVGNIGCDFRMDYTAIGDTINTAARLESNAPKGTIYVSEAVYKEVKDRVEATPIGEIPLKGKTKGVFVYSITGVKDYKSPEEVR